MHELSLASAIVDTVERHAEGRPVSVVTLSVGALRQVVPDSLEFYLGVVGRGTVCEGARLELQIVRARLACCGVEWEPPGFRCSSCGGGGQVLAGDEFMVESIEIGPIDREPIETETIKTEPVDTGEEACIART